MSITHQEKLAAYTNDPTKPVSKDAWVASHDAVIVNAEVATNAAIVESKLALNYPTHSSINDPSASEKGALVGTNGVASTSNPFVTDSDPRNTNTRTPSAHTHVAADVSSTSPTGLFLKDDGTWAVVSAGGLTGTTVVDNIVTVASTTGTMKDSGWARDTDGGLAANSDLKIPSQKAVKTYVDAHTGQTFTTPEAHGAVGDGKLVSLDNCAMTAGNTTLTSTSSHWSTSDVGKKISVRGAVSRSADLSAFTKVDAGGYLSVSPNTKVTATAMPENVTSYLYHDYGANYFAGDFIHYFDFTATKITNASNVFPYALSDSVGSPRDTGGNIAIQLGIAADNSIWFYLQERYSSVIYNSAGVNVASASGVHYWAKVTRVGTTLTMYIYSNSTRTTQVATQTLTLHSAASYRYAYAIASLTNVDANTLNLWTQNFSFVSGVLPEVAAPLVTTIASYVSGTQITLTDSATNTVTNATVVWGTDDTTAIASAISSLDSVQGGAIYFGSKIYIVSSKLTLDRPVSLIGFGSAWAPIINAGSTTLIADNYFAGTTLFWMNSIGDKMMSATAQRGIYLNQIILHCNELATYGIWADRIIYSQIFNLYILRPAIDGMLWTCTSNVANDNCMFNQVNNLSIYRPYGGGSASVGFRMTSQYPTIQNCCHNRIYTIKGEMVNDNGDYLIYIDAADNNTFLDVYSNTVSESFFTTSKAMYFGTNSGSNFVYHIQAFPGGVENNNNATTWGANVIHDYDRLNSQLEPTLTGGILVWDEVSLPGIVAGPTVKSVLMGGRYFCRQSGGGDVLTTDAASGFVVKGTTGGHYWRIQVNSTGTVTTTDLGTTLPTE